MIPDIPESLTSEQAVDFYSQLAGNLSDQSTIHVHWYTHRGNPAACWICDSHILISKLLDLLGGDITKSSQDIETSLVQESGSDSEIESDYNEPEYELADDEVEPE